MLVTVITCAALSFFELLVLITFLEIFAEPRLFYEKHKILVIVLLTLSAIFEAFPVCIRKA